jgi:hypothetical protein
MFSRCRRRFILCLIGMIALNTNQVALALCTVSSVLLPRKGTVISYQSFLMHTRKCSIPYGKLSELHAGCRGINTNNKDSNNNIKMNDTKLAVFCTLHAFQSSSSMSMSSAIKAVIAMVIVTGGIFSIPNMILPQPAFATTTSIITASSEVSASGGGCVSGVGEMCASYANGNQYIQQLQARSAQNREQYQQQNLQSYYMKNYPDFFATTGQTLIQKADGTYMIVNDREMVSLQKSNRLRYVTPTAMGGAIVDLTQKPIPVLKEE